MEYVCAVEAQTAEAPVMVPGVPGTDDDTVMLKLCTALLPQELLAFTVIVPLVEFVVVVIEFVVEVPVHPEGNVHVYDVAPETAAIE
jgi:hypothetical protein